MNSNKRTSISISGIKNFIDSDIWEIKADPKKEFLKYYTLSIVKVLILSFEGFIKDNVQIRSSALTYFSLLSIVPLLAMAFGIAKGFDLEKQLHEKLMENFSGQAEVIDQSISFAQNLLENTQGGLIAGIGFVVLVYSVLRLFSNIEQSFNTIWNVKKERSIVRKLSDYLAIVLLAPVFLVAASSLTIQITTIITDLTNEIEFLGILESLFLPLLRILPYTVIWTLFLLMYMIMPNTRVKFKSALIAAVIAGSAYQLTQWGLINFQVGVSRYNAIYGSFAALPLFLFWLQLSWLIFLFGAELAFSHQNISNFERDVAENEMSRQARMEAVFVIATYVIKKFVGREHAPGFETIAQDLKLPVKITHSILEELVEAEILTRTEDTDGDLSAYQPATDPNYISFAFIMEKMNTKGKNSIWDEKDFDFEQIRSQVDIMNKEFSLSSASILLKDIKLK